MASDIRSYLIRDNPVNANHRVPMGIKNFKVSEIIEKKEGFVNPVVVTFQNGELNSQYAADCKVTFTTDDNAGTNVFVETPSGHIFKDSHCRENPREKQFIAIRNKKTNKVRLVEVDRTVLINSVLLKPSTNNAPPGATPAEQAKNLSRTFGGKKVAVRLEQREKLNLSSMPVAEDVKKAVENIKVEENISNNKTETDSILLLVPPCHRNATELSQIYRIEEILSEPELQSLQEEMSRMNEKNEFDSSKFSEFFLNCLSEAKSSKADLDIRLAGLLFIEALINFLKMPSRKITKKNSDVCPFSSCIQEKILNEFCIKTEKSITRPQTMRDKAIMYIIALCLICCNYKVNLILLSKTATVHLKRIIRLAQIIGAVPIAKNSEIFTLKIPLPSLPKSSKGKIQRKNKMTGDFISDKVNGSSPSIIN